MLSSADEELRVILGEETLRILSNFFFFDPDTQNLAVIVWTWSDTLDMEYNIGQYLVLRGISHTFDGPFNACHFIADYDTAQAMRASLPSTLSNLAEIFEFSCWEFPHSQEVDRYFPRRISKVANPHTSSYFGIFIPIEQVFVYGLLPKTLRVEFNTDVQSIPIRDIIGISISYSGHYFLKYKEHGSHNLGKIIQGADMRLYEVLRIPVIENEFLDRVRTINPPALPEIANLQGELFQKATAFNFLNKLQKQLFESLLFSAESYQNGDLSDLEYTKTLQTIQKDLPHN